MFGTGGNRASDRYSAFVVNFSHPKEPLCEDPGHCSRLHPHQYWTVTATCYYPCGGFPHSVRGCITPNLPRATTAAPAQVLALVKRRNLRRHTPVAWSRIRCVSGSKDPWSPHPTAVVAAGAASSYGTGCSELLPSDPFPLDWFGSSHFSRAGLWNPVGILGEVTDRVGLCCCVWILCRPGYDIAGTYKTSYLYTTTTTTTCSKRME